MKTRKDAARDERRTEFLVLLLELDRLDPAACGRMLVLAEKRVKVSA